MNQSVDSVFIKGYYHFLRQLLESGFSMPGQLVNLILDQLACSNLATDIETQLDIVVMMSYLTKFLNSLCVSLNLARFSCSCSPVVCSDSNIYLIRIFVHLLRILNILTGVLQGKPIPPFKESKAPTTPPNPEAPPTHAPNLDANGEPLGSVQSQPQYLQLWEKLQDVYRVSLTSLNPNLFDDICHHAIHALSRVINALGRLVLPFLEELLLALPEHFEREADGVISCLTALVASSTTQMEAAAGAAPPNTNARGVTFTAEKAEASAAPPAPAENISAASSIFNLTIPTYSFLLPSPKVIPVPKAATDAILPARRRFPKSFEPMLTLCMEKYDKIQSVPLRRSILRMLTTLAMAEGDYAQADKELNFLRNLHTGIMKAQSNYKVASETHQGAAGASGLPSRVAASLYFTDILGPQLAFLYEIHLRLSINLVGTFTLNTVDLALLLPLAFEVSWRSPDSDAAFSAMANVLFLPNLEGRQKRKRSESQPLQRTLSHSSIKRVGSPGGPTPPVPGTEDISASQQEEARIEAATLRDMRREFINQLLILLPDARAVSLLKQIVALLRAFPEDIKATIFFEFARVISARIQQLLIESHLLVKNSVAELLSLGELIDELPKEVFIVETMVAALFDAALSRPLPEPIPPTIVVQQESIASKPGQPAAGTKSASPQQPQVAPTPAADMKRPENVERKMIATQNRWWLPRVVVLMRVLVKFDENALLDASKRINASVLMAGRDQSPEAAFSGALYLLIERASAESSRGVPDEESERWSRLYAILIHFVAYFVDSKVRGQASRIRRALRAIFASPFQASGSSEPGTLQSSVERLRELLRGVISSYLASCGFMMCKLFDELQIEELPHMMLEILMSTDATSLTAVKWSWHLEMFKSVVCVTLARVAVRLAAPPQSGPSSVLSPAKSGLLVCYPLFPSMLQRPFLIVPTQFDDAIPAAVSYDTSFAPVPSKLVSNLLSSSNEDMAFLDLLTRQVIDPDVKELIGTMARQPHLHARICSYVERLMSRDAKLEMLSPQRVHELFLLLTYIPPTVDSLRLIFEFFSTNGHISVQIACEHFLWTLMNSDLFGDKDLVDKRKSKLFGTSPIKGSKSSIDLLLLDHLDGPGDSPDGLQLIDDTKLKKLVESYRSVLRPSFQRKLRKMHWLQLVSLSQTDLPSLGPEMEATVVGSSSPMSAPIQIPPDSPSTPPQSPRRIPSAIPTTVMRNTIRMETGVQIIRGSSLEPKSFLKYFENRDNSYYLKIIQTLTAVMPVSKDLFVKILRSTRTPCTSAEAVHYSAES